MWYIYNIALYWIGAHTYSELTVGQFSSDGCALFITSIIDGNENGIR